MGAVVLVFMSLTTVFFSGVDMQKTLNTLKSTSNPAKVHVAFSTTSVVLRTPMI